MIHTAALNCRSVCYSADYLTNKTSIWFFVGTFKTNNFLVLAVPKGKWGWVRETAVIKFHFDRLFFCLFVCLLACFHLIVVSVPMFRKQSHLIATCLVFLFANFFLRISSRFLSYLASILKNRGEKNQKITQNTKMCTSSSIKGLRTLVHSSARSRFILKFHLKVSPPFPPWVAGRPIRGLDLLVSTL